MLPRVMHVTVILSYGGMEMMLARLIEADRGRREHWVVSLLDDSSPDPSDSYSKRLTALGATVISLGFKRGRPSLAGLMRLWRAYRSCRPALLSGWNYHANLAVALLSLLSARRVKAICNVRCSLQPGRPNLKQRVFFLAHMLAARASAITVFNARRAADEHVIAGYPAKRVVVIPNGFDVQRFRPEPQLRAATRAKLGLAPDTVAVGCVGRLDPDKDHQTFLAAAIRAAETNAKLGFLLVGDGTTRLPEMAECAAPMETLGDRLLILGHVGDMPALYNALDICALSSRTEGFPNALGEAMACGVPCISTDVGDAAFLIGDTGVLCPPSDPSAFAEALLRLASQDLAAHGEAARRRIADCFSLEAAHAAFAELWSRYATGAAKRRAPQARPEKTLSG
jgi:glycosyltransferase involved in cell wall biosynthesis